MFAHVYSSWLHTGLATGIFLAVTAVLCLATRNQMQAQQHTGEPEPVVESERVVPAFEELLDQVQNGSLVEKERAAALLMEYPDRVGEFAEPLSRAFVQADLSFQRVANRVFAFLGNDAVPVLESMYRPEENQTAEQNEIWRQACGTIRAIGDPARAVYEPKLLEVLDNSDDPAVRVPALYALTGFTCGCPEAIEKALVDLKHEDFNVSLFACRLIIKTGPAAAAAVADLRNMLANGNLSQRTYAAWALGAIGPTDEYDPLPDLEPMLLRFTLAERERALTGVGLLGEHAARLEPKVREMMMTPETNLEARAGFVLWQISGNTTDTVPRLVELAQTLDFELSALDFLAQMGPEAREATDFLLERSKSSDYSIRIASVDALVSINPESERVVQRIEELTEDPSPMVRLAAEMARKKLDPAFLP